VQARGARPYKGPGQGALEGAVAVNATRWALYEALTDTGCRQGLVRRLHQVPRAIQRFRKLPMLASLGGAGRLIPSTE
jgi:hypothetical protein